LVYESDSQLPATIRKALPAEARGLFRSLLTYASYIHTPARAHAYAWNGLKREGWRRGNDGIWAKLPDTAPVELQLKIEKTDEPQRMAFGWLSVAKTRDGATVVDHHGHIVPPEELEQATYDYMLNSRRGDSRHGPRFGGKRSVAKLVECMAFTQEKMAAIGIPEGSVHEGTWVGYKYHDEEAWRDIESGVTRMFSFGGHGVLVDANPVREVSVAA